MNPNNVCKYFFLCCGLVLLTVMPASAQFSIDWSTIDGGGGVSSGGPFELSGTIGQYDAGAAMSGADFSLTGGYWSGSAAEEVILGDLNGDGLVNLLDVAPFVAAISSGTYIPEADINQDGQVNLLDVDPFIDLLGGG